MDLKDLISFPTTSPSLSVLPSMLNASLQTCGLNSMQQPSLIPWSSQLTTSSLPFTVMPVLNQSVISPLTPSLAPTSRDPLILVPLSPAASQSMPTQSGVSASPVLYPTFQQMSALTACPVSVQNNYTAPLVLNSNSTLPILSQPSLHQSQSRRSSNGMNVSISNETRGINPYHSATSPLQEKTTVNTALKRQRKQFDCLTGQTLSTVSAKADHSLSSLSMNAKSEISSLLVGKGPSVQKQTIGWNLGNKTEPAQVDSDISKIISSLPPGWTVVGLTSLDNANIQLPFGSEKHQMPDPSSTLPIVQTQSVLHSRHSSPPDVVSVDLNVSSAIPIVSSPVAVDNISTINISNRNKCMVQLRETSSDKLISMKTEGTEETDGVAGRPVEDSWNKDIENSSRNDGLKLPPSLLASVKTEPPSWIQTESENKQCPRESQWTVVGVTSLSVAQTTPVNPVPQNALPNLLPLISSPSTPSQVPPCQGGPSTKAISSKTTILNVPLPKISHTVKNLPLPGSVAATSEALPSSSTNPGTLNGQSENGSQNAMLSDSEWTVVGVTFSPSPVKTSSVYSSAGMQQLVPVDQSLPPNLNLIPVEALKSELIGNINNQQANPNFSEVIKALSTLVQGEERPLGSSNMAVPALSDEWKVVGITPLPCEQTNVVKLSEKHQPSLTPASAAITSLSTFPTSTTSISNGVISCPTVTNSSLPNNTSDIVFRNLLNDALNRSGTSPSLTAADSDLQQNYLLQLLKEQLLQQQLQQQQQRQQHQQQQHEQKNHVPIPSEIMNTNHVDLLNKYQNIVGILSNNSTDSQNCHHSAMLSKSPSPNSHIDIAPCPQEPTPSYVDTKPPGNPKPSFSRFQSRFRKSKFHCIEKCMGKSDCMSRKAKDMCVRCMTKHTVSHLLKMKRMKDKDQSDSEDKGDNFECVGQNFKIVKRLSDKILKRLTHSHSHRVDREGRSRPLHSYAGNRRLFTKAVSARSHSLQRISLRSGTQVPVCSYEPDCNRSEFRNNEAVESCANIEKDNVEENHAVFKNEPRSAARKRKLKVPRKMVADMDYHPFDSSSDSN